MIKVTKVQESLKVTESDKVQESLKVTESDKSDKSGESAHLAVGSRTEF